MKKFCAIICLILLAAMLCGCEKAAEGNKEIVRVRLLCEDEKERDRVLRMLTEATENAESPEQCAEELRKLGLIQSEEYYEKRWCGGRFFPPGYYPTFRYGEGKKGWQYVAYPALVYQSLEEYDDAGYSSFFCEIIKKMEERD